MDFQFDTTYALDVDASFESVTVQLESLGFSLVERFERGETQLREVIFVSEDQRQVVRFIDDHFVQVHLLRIQSDERQRHHELIAALRERMSLYDRLELDELAREHDIVTRSFGLRGLAAISKSFWGAVLKDYRGALSDARPDVRRIALVGISRLAWLEFLPDLERAAQSEQDPGIRDEMRELIAGLRQYGKRGTSTPW